MEDASGSQSNLRLLTALYRYSSSTLLPHLRPTYYYYLRPSTFLELQIYSILTTYDFTILLQTRNPTTGPYYWTDLYLWLYTYNLSLAAQSYLYSVLW